MPQPEIAMCYIAEPIDQAPTGDPGMQDRRWDAWRHAVTTVATICNLYRPKTAWRVGQLDHRVEQINRYALTIADVVLAFLPKGVPSIGVPMEIEAATRAGTPVVVLTDVESYALAGNPLITTIDNATDAVIAVSKALENCPGPADYPDEPRIQLVISEGHQMPTRAYDDDAGFDLTVVGNHTLEPSRFVDIPSQVEQVQIPDGHWLMITGRSSTLRKKGLHIPTAVIDTGWRGPLLTGVWNLTEYPIYVEDGERLAQAILVPMTPHYLARVGAVDPHPRGLNGFGSSG